VGELAPDGTDSSGVRHANRKTAMIAYCPYCNEPNEWTEENAGNETECIGCERRFPMPIVAPPQPDQAPSPSGQPASAFDGAVVGCLIGGIVVVIMIFYVVHSLLNGAADVFEALDPHKSPPKQTRVFHSGSAEEPIRSQPGFASRSASRGTILPVADSSLRSIHQDWNSARFEERS